MFSDIKIIDYLMKKELYFWRIYIFMNYPIGNEDMQSKFKPMLLKAEVSWDMVEPGDELVIVTWWQNVGNQPASKRLSGFIDLEFGYQRISESQPKKHRINWEPYPGMHHWKENDVWACACRWKVPEIWGGTYRLYIGICDQDGATVDVIGKNQDAVSRIYMGDIEIGWGWGRPVLEDTRKPWNVEINSPVSNSCCESFKANIQENNSIKLTSGDMAVEMDKNIPAILGISDNTAKFKFPVFQPEIYLRDFETDSGICSFSTGVNVSYKKVRIEDNTAIYSAEVLFKDINICSFDLCFQVNNRQIEVTLENVCEAKNIELLEVRIPALAAAAGNDARMVDFFMGGRQISPENSPPMGFEHLYDVRNAAAVYNFSGTIVVESAQLDNKLYQSVQQNSFGKTAVVGFSLTYRVKAYGSIKSINAAPVPKVTIDLLDESWGAPSWQAAAKFLRKDLIGKNREIYSRALLYKYIVAFGPVPESEKYTQADGQELPYPIQRLKEGHSFNQAIEMVRKVSNLIDGGKQVVYIVGWQYKGHDTGYPYVFEVDPRGGTMDELKQCIKSAKDYNAIVTMHDNYDDAYISPYFNDQIIAKDEFGKLYRGWPWAGGLSYIISPKRYRDTGLLAERVKRTVETYGIHSSYHLDVLTSEGRRYDFEPEWAAAADLSLESKKAVVYEFNKYGIDITSEILSHPFVGVIGMAWTTRDNPKDTLFPGERYIPLTSMIYHGTIQYNNFVGSDDDILRGIITGSYAGWCDVSEVREQDLKAYFLQGIPMGLLYDYKIEDYQEDDSSIFIEYENNSSVSVDKKNKNYRIFVNGQLIAHDWSTFAPGVKEGSYLAYATKAGAIEYPVPAGWNKEMAIRAVSLTEEGEGATVDFSICNEKITIQMPGNTPVRVMPVK